MSEIAFTVPGQAVPWARAGAHGSVRFTPAKQRNYAGILRTFCDRAMQGRPPLDGPIELSVMATYAWPKSWNSRKRLAPGAMWKTSRSDIDNIGKLVMDSLNTVAWEDDALIASLHLWKQYGDIPKLTVRVVPLP